ncbi:MAG: Permease of the major facilitator superfamily [Thermoleophilia bacterium]|nr:Permease of the major facilitator superfamily [Thermoleophilia bacterium]
MSDATSPDRIGVPAIAWAVYDFGYSMFAFVVFARYLSDWLISDLHQPDWVYTTGQAIAALTLLVVMPVAGVVADALGSHRPLLLVFTLGAGISGGAVGLIDPSMGPLGIVPLMACATVSAACTGLSFAQFDPMLAVVAPRRSWGTMSGIAVGAGYAGILVWIGVLADMFVPDGADKQHAFLPAAVVLLVLSVPVLTLARRSHRPEGTTPKDVRGVLGTARGEIFSAVGRLRSHRPILRLLAGRFLYTDAVGTVNVFAVVYMSRLGGFGETDKNKVTALVVLSGGVGAIVAGWCARRFGPRRVLLTVVPCFAVGLGIVAGVGQPWTVWVLAPVLGISLGTVYTVDRVFMLALTPPELRGELFGFFNLIGRVAQALGPFVLWGGTIFVLHDATGVLNVLDASRVSLGLIALSALTGLYVISSLDDGHRDGADDVDITVHVGDDPEPAVTPRPE